MAGNETRKEQSGFRNGKTKIVDWFVKNLLASVVVGVFLACLGLITWQVGVNDKIKYIQDDVINLEKLNEKYILAEAWKVAVDIHIASLQAEIIGLKATIKDMKQRMDEAMSTGAPGHLTHREHSKYERRLENLERR